MRQKICEWKELDRRLKIVVWNCQTLNKLNYDKRRIKIQHMLKLINDYFPDIIYLIDTNRQLNIGGNYDQFFDGRNILFTRKDIEMNVKTGDNMNWFEIINLKLGFIYVIPNKYNKELVEKRISYWNLNKYTYFGDFNLRSNPELEELINWKGGETTLQTGVCGKFEECKLFPAPSDHNAILVVIKRKVKASTMLDVTIVKSRYKKVIEGYLEGKFKIQSIAIPRYKLIRVRFNDSEESAVMYRIIRAFYKGNVRDLYNRIGWIWRNSKKEPFLGKKIPVKVLQSFKDEMKHDKDKLYLPIDQNHCPQTFDAFSIEKWKKKDRNGIVYDFKLELKGLKDSYSRAITMENIEIRKITSHLKYVIKKWILDKQDWKVKNIIRNLIIDHNNLIKDHRMYHLTFFLKKNKSLNSYRDVRMITISPTILRLYEALVYDTVLPDIMNVVKKEDYQFGAFPNSSTYDYLNVLRSKVYRYKARGIVSVDITKGYERITPKNLSKAIDMIESPSSKRLLEIWATFVWNTDYMINGQLVKTTRGIPMGLALSPLIFVLYLHCALKDCDKEFILAYMDDISILMLEDQQSDNNIQNILDTLISFGLDINDRKSFIFTDGEWFDKAKRIKFRIADKANLEVKSVAMMLGRELTWADDILTGDRCNFIMEHKIPKVMPNWMTLAMRRLIYIGGLTGKSRYISYMWAFKRRDVKQKILKNAYSFFSVNFEKLNYVQLFLILPNILREFIDPFDLLEIAIEVKPLIDSLPEVKADNPDDIINNKVKSIKDNAELKKPFEKYIAKLFDLFDIGMPQFDLDRNGDYEENMMLRVIAELYTFSNNPMEIWRNTKRILDIIWPLFVLIKIDKWNDQHDDVVKKYIDIVDEDIMIQTSYKTFKSLSKFAILLDLLFSRISWDDYTNWGFFVFDMLDKLQLLLEKGSITEEELFEVRKRIFAISNPEETELERYSKADEVLKALAKTEEEFFGHPFHRWKPKKGSENYEVKMQQYELWTNSKQKVKSYRKILFVLDSMYAQRKSMKELSYEELVAKFQLKYWLCHDSYDELEKVHMIQDYEDYDQPEVIEDLSDEDSGLSSEE